MGEVVREFQQHDGAVTVVVKLFPQGFAKHKGFIEDEQLEAGGAGTRLGDSWCVVPLPSSHIYIGRGGRKGIPRRAPRGPTTTLGNLP